MLTTVQYICISTTSLQLSIQLCYLLLQLYPIFLTILSLLPQINCQSLSSFLPMFLLHLHSRQCTFQPPNFLYTYFIFFPINISCITFNFLISILQFKIIFFQFPIFLLNNPFFFNNFISRNIKS